MTTILVIEDEQAIADIIYDILTAQGFTVLMAYDAPRGIEIAMEKLPDLILCDVGLPPVPRGGHEVLRQLRKNNATLAIPLIFLTAFSADEDIREGMELGADDYLTKPFSTETLLRAIETRLSKQVQLKSYYESSLERLRQSIMTSLPHEFRTPLVGILGASEFLLADLDNLELGTIRELLLDIRQSGDRLHKLIQKYLCFVRLQDRYLRYTPPETRIAASSTDLVIDIARQALSDHERESDLNAIISIESTCLNGCDCQRLFSELLDNAAKFSPAGTPILLKFFTEADYECIVVKDYGRGMAEEERQNIGALQQFQREQHEQQGAGLGLAIAQLIAKIYGGQLHIDSEPGIGTSVHVTLPKTPSP
ncbi:response regulator [[Limnothrix rosea] IAM M-220]|uniref:hybrid sensor histidine kinase/response regulator n=1 Tax=[Limnothrix rosea] IAM M-220 TaxID=454133 RepID=UPI0009676CC4|nr:response regulator [[Limnothrix rosea] IAM M-220]OKH18125.1 hypothetical protein NIES208_07220 [[Limnothrix rosea] IAM M-220]